MPTTNNDGDENGFGINGDVLPVQSDGTEWDAFCGVRNPNEANNGWTTLAVTCWNLLDGSERAMPPGLDTVTNGEYGWFFGYEGVATPDTRGHRVYFTMLRDWSQGDRLVCYDYAANGGAGGVCPNFPYDLAEPAGGLRTYATALDTTGTCVWTLGDAGILRVRSAIDPTEGCATSSSQIAVTPADSYCGDDQSGPSWDEIALRGLDPTADFASGFITVRGTDGAIVPGFSHIAVPANGRVDISSIPKSGTTASLSITAIFGGITIAKFESGDALLQATWSGEAMPSYCFDTLPVVSCSTADQDLHVDSTTTFTAALSGTGAPLPASRSLTRLDPAAADCAAANVVVEACSSGVILECDPDIDGMWSPSATILQNLQTTFRVTLTNTGTATLTDVVVTATALSACGHTMRIARTRGNSDLDLLRAQRGSRCRRGCNGDGHCGLLDRGLPHRFGGVRGGAHRRARPANCRQRDVDGNRHDRADTSALAAGGRQRHAARW